MRRAISIIIVSGIAYFVGLVILADMCLAYYPVLSFRLTVAGNDDWMKTSNAKVQKIDPKLDAMSSGLTIKKFGLEMTLCEYKEAKMPVNNDTGVSYVLSDGKTILLLNSLKNRSQVDMSFDSLHYSPMEERQIEHASGKKMYSCFDYELASYQTTPSDFTVFDYQKNFGVVELLKFKYIGGRANFGSLFLVQNDRVIALIFNHSSYIIAEFANPKDTEYNYSILFQGGFCLDDVATILNTIIFDDSK